MEDWSSHVHQYLQETFLTKDDPFQSEEDVYYAKDVADLKYAIF